MPFYEEMGISLEAPEPEKLKLNWKTGAIIVERPLGVLSARHAEHDAGWQAFLSGHPDLNNFGRSGMRHMKAARFSAALEPKRVELKAPEEGALKKVTTIGAVDGQDREDSTKPSALKAPPSALGTAGNASAHDRPVSTDLPRNSAVSRKLALTELLQSILQRLIAGNGVQVMLSASAHLLELVRGEGETSLEVRVALKDYAGILRGLVKLIKLCQPPHHVHKPIVFKTLSQVAFYNKSNSKLLAGEESLLQQLILAVYSSTEALQTEAVRLINNLIASSFDAAQKLSDHSGMLEAIKRLCSHQTFTVRFLGVCAVNGLTRHSLSHPKLNALLTQANIVEGLMDKDAKNQAFSEQHNEQQRLFGFMVTCAVGNMISTIERRTWTALEPDLETAVHVLHASFGAEKMAGVTFRTQSVLMSIQFLSVSDPNRKTLVQCGLVEELAKFVETWQEDPKTDLANQLKCLELSLDLLLTLLNVDGQTVFQKSCVFKTEVKKRLRDLDFGAALFRITKDRPSLLAVDYAHRLIKELRLELMPDSRSQAEGVTAGKPGSYKSSPRSKTQISTRMIGTSSSIPRSAHPAWEHPLKHGCGGAPPSIARPHRAQEPGRPCTADVHFAILADEDGSTRATGLAWNTLAKLGMTQLIHKQIINNWKRLFADLKRARGGGSLSTAVDLYKLLGSVHRVWYPADEWEDLVAALSVETFADAEIEVDLTPLLTAADDIIHPRPSASDLPCGGNRFMELPSTPGGTLAVLHDGGMLSAESCKTGKISHEGAKEMTVKMMMKQVQADVDFLLKALSDSKTVSVLRLQALLASIGWVLTKSQLERVRQTFETMDVNYVNAIDFSQLLRQVTIILGSHGVVEIESLIEQISRPSGAEMAVIKRTPGSGVKDARQEANVSRTSVQLESTKRGQGMLQAHNLVDSWQTRITETTSNSAGFAHTSPKRRSSQSLPGQAGTEMMPNKYRQLALSRDLSWRWASEAGKDGSNVLPKAVLRRLDLRVGLARARTAPALPKPFANARGRSLQALPSHDFVFGQTAAAKGQPHPLGEPGFTAFAPNLCSLLPCSE